MEKCTDTVVNWMIRCNAITRRIRNFTSMHYIVFFYWYHHLSLQELLALAWEA